MKPLVSLTFDDGLPCHLDNVIPMLNARGIRGTFFIPAGCPDYVLAAPGAWKEAISVGHEVGSHSWKHRKVAEMGDAECAVDTKAAKSLLEHQFGVPMKSYCYPYTDAPERLQAAVRKHHLQARGGRGARADKFLIPGDGANLYNVPSFHVGPYTCTDSDQWAAEVVTRGAWLTLMFHGVGEPQAWDNISTMQFDRLLGDIADAGASFVTFAEGADAYRGQ